MGRTDLVNLNFSCIFTYLWRFWLFNNSNLTRLTRPRTMLTFSIRGTGDRVENTINIPRYGFWQGVWRTQYVACSWRAMYCICSYASLQKESKTSHIRPPPLFFFKFNLQTCYMYRFSCKNGRLFTRTMLRCDKNSAFL